MYRIFIQGIVQGVGFRPYIYRKAKEYNLVGSVRNIGNGVEIIINDKEFTDKLSDLPPLARITSHEVSPVTNTQEFSDFSIIDSTTSDGATILPADIFTCKDCINELKDFKNRRNNYYFITCTNCGPRYSMIYDYPYDRPYTAMNNFEMCDECRKEYLDPMNRRYHAQTIACKNCGPKLKLISEGKDITTASDQETIKSAVEILKNKGIISIKGVGGFHICCLCNEVAVRKLRIMVNRPNKPFAVMAKDVEMVKKFCIVSDKERALLLSPERPIVVLRKKEKSSFMTVSELDSIGVMLPYTALHYLMFDFLDEPLTMTSCNYPGSPVAVEEVITDHFLTHERDIINRCDDSVVKLISGKPFFLRRSRGYAPVPVKIPVNCVDTIAVGAEMNNVICTVKENNCFLSQYIGVTSKLDTFHYLKRTIMDFIRLTRLSPKIIACDLHPGYNSTAFAHELSKIFNAKLIQVQHHKAHIASVAAEHNLTNYIGIVMDGLGYGEDGKIWGGEVFDVTDSTNFRRIGHLEEQPQIGGDSATTYPRKMLIGILSKIINEEEIYGLNLFCEKETKLYMNMLKQNFNIPLTTSAGRILDSVAALIGICNHRTYDGRPAMILESTASIPLDLKPEFSCNENKRILLTTPLIKFILEHINEDKGKLAATAQLYLATGLYEIAKGNSSKPIVFSGGVAYNRMISEFMLRKGVLTNNEIPCGDGGICYGQAYLANVIK
ncbi:MAG: carbamoyltransferase HypF [archaeon]